jgi:hypothetical protein
MRRIAGSQRSFCSSEPHRSIEDRASPPCTPKNVDIEGSIRESSMLTIEVSSFEWARRSGQARPRPTMSSSAKPGMRSKGKSVDAQAASATGAMRSSAKWRTRARISCSSGSSSSA